MWEKNRVNLGQNWTRPGLNLEKSLTNGCPELKTGLSGVVVSEGEQGLTGEELCKLQLQFDGAVEGLSGLFLRQTLVHLSAEEEDKSDLVRFKSGSSPVQIQF